MSDREIEAKAADIEQGRCGSSAFAPIVVEIAKLSPEPGDLIIFRFKQRLSFDAVERIQNIINRQLPDGVKLLILDGDTDMPLVCKPAQVKTPAW